MAHFHKCFAHETCFGISVQETGDLSPKQTLLSIWDLRLTQSVIQRALSAFYLGVKLTVREADNPPQSTADVKNTGTPHLHAPIRFHSSVLNYVQRHLSLFINLN
jgi:hypothetical protein